MGTQTQRKSRLEEYLERINVKVSLSEDVVREALKVARENRALRRRELEEVRKYFLSTSRGSRRRRPAGRRRVK